MVLLEAAVWYAPVSMNSFCFMTLVIREANFLMQASVDDELGIPVKFVGVGEGVEDLQPFDAEAFVNAIFSTRRSSRR
jgi:hypothetical protein